MRCALGPGQDRCALSTGIRGHARGRSLRSQRLSRALKVLRNFSTFGPTTAAQ